MDIIWPVIEAQSRAVTYGAYSRNLIMRAIKLEIRLSVIEVEPETRFQFKPNHTSDWVGFHSDLAELGTKPTYSLMTVCTINEWPLAVCNDSPLQMVVEKHNYFNTINPPKLNRESKAFGKNVRG